jgi:hypothetical protein
VRPDVSGSFMLFVMTCENAIHWINQVVCGYDQGGLSASEELFHGGVPSVPTQRIERLPRILIMQVAKAWIDSQQRIS